MSGTVRASQRWAALSETPRVILPIATLIGLLIATGPSVTVAWALDTQPASTRFDELSKLPFPQGLPSRLRFEAGRGNCAALLARMLISKIGFD